MPGVAAIRSRYHHLGYLCSGRHAERQIFTPVSFHFASSTHDRSHTASPIHLHLILHAPQQRMGLEEPS